MAHEYGWAKDKILEDVYFDELFLLVKNINKRKLTEYKVQLAIAQNPYTKNPKQLWTLLKQMDENESRMQEFDSTGFELLKQQLSQNPRFIVKD